MNEQIKKFAVDAGVGESDLGIYSFYEGDLDKFAKLIILECIKVCKLRAGNSDYNTGRMHCASDIAEYFGIEK